MTARPATLAIALDGASVDLATVQRRHRAQVAIVRKMLGVVPNATAYLEIWPTGLRTYNLLVPNFLNLPFLLLGFGPPKATVALAMFAASRAAGCAYCMAHTCSFALQRGADDGDLVRLTDHQSATAAHSGNGLPACDVADALGRLPSSLTPAKRDAFLLSASAADTEWVVLAIAMMGFLNKFMDAMGIPLEASMLSTAKDVIGPAGWTPGQHLAPGGTTPLAPRPPADNILNLLGLLPVLPSVIYRDKRWTSGTPHTWPAVGAHLRERTGHDFPILSHLRHARAIRALATILADNTDMRQSRIGLRTKHLAGLVYATRAEDAQLVRSARILAEHAGATTAQLDGSLDGLDRNARLALILAGAASSSPAQITPDIVAATADALTSAAIVEILVWISVMQLLHRLHAFYS